MAKSLLDGVVRGMPDGMHASAPDAEKRNPVDALRYRTTETLYRDLAAMGIPTELAERVVGMVTAAINPALNAEGVTIEDKTAVALVTERVVAAVMVAVAQHSNAQG